MSFGLAEAMAILARTPGVLDAALRDLPAAWLDTHEGPETWSPRDVVGHLIHGEDTDWIPRARATWAVHDLNHVGQITRVMAKRLADDVGPWRAYLGILRGS